MSITVDNSDFSRFAAELGATAQAVEHGVEQVVSKGALNIKNEMNAALAGSRHFHGIAGTVTYDLHSGGGYVEAEIGPDKGVNGGALANVAFFGTSRGGGTVEDPQVALDNEAPRFEKALADLIGKLA